MALQEETLGVGEGLGGCEAAVAVLVALLVSALTILIYRAIRGPRAQHNHRHHQTQHTHTADRPLQDEEEEEEEEENHSESTGSDLDSEDDSADALLLDEENHRPTLHEPGVDNPPGEPCKTDAAPPEKGVKEDPLLDTDEASETESAQEKTEPKNILSCTSQSMDDLSDIRVSSHEFGNKLLRDGTLPPAMTTITGSGTENDTRTSGGELENGVRTACGSIDVKGLQNLHEPNQSVPSNNVPPSSCQTFVGFAPPDQRGISSAVVQTQSESGGTEKVSKNNEISIMEAIMESNEWLNAGPPDTKDVPWLNPKPSGSGGFHTTPSSVLRDGRCLMEQPRQENPGEHGDAGNQDHPVSEDNMGTAHLVPVSFQVHYVTHSPHQVLGVTGDQEELGFWRGFVPLIHSEGDFWFGSVRLPSDRWVEWKFVVVEDGEIRRWEECGNRSFVVTGQDGEMKLDEQWGLA